MKLSNLEIIALQGCHLGKLRQVLEEYSTNIIGEKCFSSKSKNWGSRRSVLLFLL